MPYLYKVFGLILDSELEILHLPKVKLNGQNFFKPDITIRLGSVPAPEVKKSLNQDSNYFFAEDTNLVLQFTNVGRFLIQKGSSITIEPFGENPHLGTLSTFLMGSAMGGVLHQRGYLLLHGNAIVYQNKAYMFAGESGAGKSTLAAAFSQAGCEVLSDDVSAVVFDESGKPWVLPAYPAMKLWQDAADYFQIDTQDCHPVVLRENKYHVSYANIFCESPRPLEAIYFLDKKTENFSVKSLEAIGKIQSILQHTYVKRYLDVMGFASQHLEVSTRLAKTCQMYEVCYPHYRDCQEKLMKLVCPELNFGFDFYLNKEGIIV